MPIQCEMNVGISQVPSQGIQNLYFVLASSCFGWNLYDTYHFHSKYNLLIIRWLCSFWYIYHFYFLLCSQNLSWILGPKWVLFTFVYKLIITDLWIFLSFLLFFSRFLLEKCKACTLYTSWEKLGESTVNGF